MVLSIQYSNNFINKTKIYKEGRFIIMLMHQLNPFIRYAQIIRTTQNVNFCKCTDCRLYYVYSGKIRISIENQNYTLTPNALFYCCGGSEYRITFEENTSIFSLNFDLTQSKSHIITPFIPQDAKNNAIPVFYDHVADSDLLNSFYFLPNANNKLHQVEKIINEFSQQKIFFRERASAILKDILICLHRPTNNNTYKLNEIIQFIHENYSSSITNKELAALAGYHEYYLNSLFKKYTGINMHEYVINTRINESKKLLEFSGLSIAEIAAQTGFNNYAYFSECFKQNVGLSPSHYRKSRQNII